MASTTSAKPKRGPTVLVTDAREVAQQQRPQMAPRTSTTRLISVDNVLQYASEIPSGQRRGPVPERPRHTRTPSGRHPLDPRLSGRLAPQYMPSRSSKVSEKLVLLPEADEEDLPEEELLDGFRDDEDQGPPDDNELERIRSERAGVKEKSYAERLPKARRAEKLARVTAYCTAQSYKLRATADFVKNQHAARTKLYDDCLYTVYHLPLLGGHDGYRVRSSPVLKSPGGKSVLDEEIERNENREYHEGYFGDNERYGIRAHEEGESPSQSPRNGSVSRTSEDMFESPRSPHRDGSQRSMSPPRIAPDALGFGEMFVYSYGVVVFWNFTERQEKDILADLTFSQSITNVALVTRPQQEEDFETEEFHFEYNPGISRPRVYNDMITLRSGDHMIKLAMSHAIAQSTKLSFFEERMAQIMIKAQYVPRRLALTGKLGMQREEVVSMLGQLFASRVDVNLSSNMLDVPNFFWESEPTLHPLYAAIREYLEIKPRIQVLNERCRVFLDLAEILSDSIADKKMTRITWIIIVLIILSILVTCSEVFLRFGILTQGKKKESAANAAFMVGGGVPLPMCSPREDMLL
ncbi:putative sporulation protein rmd8 [Diplodia seriata]|uniref:Sad1-interacting factor 3 n=2 Tax=Diplodia TaxID=66735 RepID=A0ABR3TVC5_9PEZI|nr:putative sporulation protein rmd8 [Diplodia seriata]OMP82546.1 Sad1-interacting factor 3 [Diplodia seriata]